MDNNYRPPSGDPGDHQPTEQFWPGQGTPPGGGQGTPAGSQDPGQRQPGQQAYLAGDRRKALRWTAGIAVAAVLLGGGVIAGIQLASPTLSTTPAASTGSSTGIASTSTTGGAGQSSQAALLNAALSAAADPNAAAATTAGAAASGTAGSGTAASPTGAGLAAGPCARAVRAARLARLKGRPAAARRAAAVAVVRCRFIRHRIIRFFLLRGIDGQFTFRSRTGTIRTLAYERGVIQSVTSSSIVVKGADGTTSTWDLVSNTVVREPGHVVSESALGDGEQVWVGGPVVNGTKDARLVFVNPPSGSS